MKYVKSGLQLIIITFFVYLICISCDNPKNSKLIKNKISKEEKEDSLNLTIEQRMMKEIAKKEKFTKLNTKTAPAFIEDYGNKNRENLVLIETKFGNIKIYLYNETPLHRANFIRLVKEKYFNYTLFYRVVKGFIIQGGNTDDDIIVDIKKKFGKYKIPNEIKPHLIHKRGAVAMARDYGENPEKLSSFNDFYIVQGRVFSDAELDGVERQYEKSVNKTKRAIYTTIGGAPHLDGEHTVFGEVVEGMDVVDKIAEVETDGGDWPKVNVSIKATVIEE